MLRDQIIAALKGVYDPEIPVNIYDLGLVYGIEVDEGGVARVRMTLTAPNCPVAGSLPAEVQRVVRSVPGVTDAGVDLVFDPPWGTDKMSPAAKLALGIEDVVPPARLKR